MDVALREARPHRFALTIPVELRPWMLDADWERSRLWAINSPVSRIHLRDVEWHFGLPWWRGTSPGAWFTVRPAEVFAAPERYPEHSQRIRSADLSYPVHVIERRDRLLILDGIHRAAKAHLAGIETLPAVRLTPVDLRQLLVDA